MNLPSFVRALFSTAPPAPASAAPRDGAALRQACESGELDAAVLELDLGADPNALDADGVSPLMAASGAGFDSVVRRLLERGADPSLRGADGRTAAFFAANEDALECLEELARAGASVDDPCCDQGWTPLMCAARNSHERSGHGLLALGADPSIVAHGGKTAATLADPLLCPSLRGAIEAAMERREIERTLPAATAPRRPSSL